VSMALFAFAPNWRYSVSETLGYSTSVVQATDGTEYRDILRNNPRTILAYTHTEHGDITASTRGINANMWRNHADVVVCPYWPDGQPITLQIGPGFVVPTIAGRDFEVGGLVAAIKPDGVGAYYEVTNIVVGSTSTAITTDKSDGLSFGAGDMLYPAYEAEINGIVPSSRITASLVEYQVTVELFGRPQKENGLFIYRNAPLLQMPPNRVDAVSAENNRILAIIESVTGRNFRLDQPGREFVARAHDYLLRNRSELSQMRSYFAHMQGRLRSFWVSNFQRDIDVLADVSAGGDALTIRRIDYDTTYDQLVGRSDIAIKLRSGQVIYREITGSTAIDANTELLEVFPAFSGGLLQSDIAQVSWLDRCRLASDEIEIVWETSEVSRVRLPLLGVIEGVIMSIFEDVDWRRAVIAASTGNVTISSPGATMDGVTLSDGDRVLLRAQTDQSQNGIYVWTAGNVDLVRADDANASALMQPGTAGIVLRGATYGQHMFFLDTVGTIDLGTTNLDYKVYDLRQVLGGNGISVSGRTVTAVAASAGGLSVGAGGISALVVGGGGLSVGASGLSVRRGPGISTISNDIAVDLTTNGGLEFSGSGATRQLKVKPGDGIALSASGVDVDLATDPALEFESNKLRLKVGETIERTASGAEVKRASSSGLEQVSGGLRVKASNGLERLAADAGLAVKNYTFGNHEFSSTTNTFTLPSTPVTGSVIIYTSKNVNNAPLPAAQVASTGSPFNQEQYYTVSGNTVTFGGNYSSGNKAFFKYIPG
jgi:hypothetical protein